MHHAALLSALALFSAVSAVPVKRDVEIETVTEVDYVFQMVTATVWVDPVDPVTTEIGQYTAPPAAPTTTSSAARIQQYKAPPPPPPPAPTTSSSTTSVAPPPPPPTTTSTSTTAAPAPPPAPTTTSVYQAPEQPAYVPPPPAPTTSTTPAPAPAPAPTTETPAPAPPAPTTTAQAAPSSAPSSGSGSGSASSSPNGNTYTGEITYYTVGLGSCGTTNSDSEMVVAMSAAMMNKATMCGKSITLSYQGITQKATVVDTCPGCASGSLDLSPTLFKAIAPNGDGRVHDVKWWFD